MCISAQKKNEILHRVLKGQVSVSSVCRENNISRKTFYEWKNRYLSSAPRNKPTCLEDGHLRGLRHPRGTKEHFRDQVLGIVVAHPELGSHAIAKISNFKFQTSNGRKYGLGNHGVYSLLKELGLETYSKRKEFALLHRSLKKIKDSYFPGQRRFLSEARKRMVEEVILAGRGVGEVAKDFKVSRKTLWKWVKRYQEAQKKEIELVLSLEDQNPRGSAHPKGTPGWLEKKIIDLVALHPEYSTHKLAALIPEVGNHGIQNVLFRNELNTLPKRQLYASMHIYAQPTIQPATGWFNRLRSVFETFVPSVVSAPPPFSGVRGMPSLKERATSILRPFFSSFLTTSFLTYIFLAWVSMLSGQPMTVKIGLMFATSALIIGSFFFLYSMKYYLTLALVLSFSSQNGVNAKLTKESKNMRKQGWLAKIFGINNSSSNIASFNYANSLAGSPGVVDDKEEGEGYVPAGGLQSDLSHVELGRYPFISIQLPFYNEKKVANRIISACTSFDYPNFEVVVCDDSTDETVQIVNEWANHPRVKILHRPTREGFKGGALRYALQAMDPKTEFIVVFDADFVPYPDTLMQFMRYYKATGAWNEKKVFYAKDLMTMQYDTNDPTVQENMPEEMKRKLAEEEQAIRAKGDMAVVAGYQWHVLNKSENWITRGVRTEYAGSYVIERPGQEILGAMKIIHGSVYCMRADVIKHFGWGISITEDYELTLRIYAQGFRVIYTPYIQAPSECVSTIKRLIRQRMRWAEGDSYNTRKQFLKLIIGSFRKEISPDGKIQKTFIPSPLTFMEKFEFLYLAPYYLQAAFFIVGTLSWLIAETVFKARLPFWTSLWGWSMVLTNFFAMPLLNGVGLFLEEAEEKDYIGLLSFVILSYLVVPFQAYAAVKGFIEPKEGTWFRTPKTGTVTDTMTRGRFYRWLTGIIRWKPAAGAIAHDRLAEAPALNLNLNHYLALDTAHNVFDNFYIPKRRIRWIGKTFLSLLLLVTTTIMSLAPGVPYFIKPVEAQTNSFGMLVSPTTTSTPEQATISASLTPTVETVPTATPTPNIFLTPTLETTPTVSPITTLTPTPTVSPIPTSTVTPTPLPDRPIPKLLFKPNQRIRKTQVSEGTNSPISITSEENPEFEFDMKDAKFDNLWKESTDNRKSSIIAKVQHAKIEKDNLPVDISFDDQSRKLMIRPQNINHFQAGLYHVTVIVPAANGNITIDQDFTWGVLAVNTNRSIYTPGEKVDLGMAVLNDTGKTLCIEATDETRVAKVWLTITSPMGTVASLSTENGTIKGNPECFSHSATNTPDYEVSYTNTSEIGNYKIHLTAQTANGTRELDDSFDVDNTVPFGVERLSFPTRIFPPADYPNTFVVKANQNFSGEIHEIVPDGFDIKNTTPRAEVVSLNNEKEIVWNVNLSRGETINLSYTFLAPNVSPEFYLLGPLQFIDTAGTEAFKETRQWQIAADATITSNGTGPWATGGTWTGGVAPGSGDVAQIRNGHTVTMNASPTIQAIIIDSGGILTNNGAGQTLTLTNTSGTLFTFTSGGTFTPGTYITVTMNPAAAVTCFGGTGSLTGTNSLYILNLAPALGAASIAYTLGSVALRATGGFSINPSRSTASTVYTLTVNMGNTIVVDPTATLTITKTGSYAASNLSTNTSNAITAGKINIATGGTLTAGSSMIIINGTTSTLLTRAGVFTRGTSTVKFQPGGNVTLTSGTFQTTNAFNNFTYDASGYTGTLGAAITINATLAISNGTLADGGNQIAGVAGQSMTMASGTQLNIGNGATATVFPSNYANGTIVLNDASTVLYQSTGAQTVSGVPTYGNLSVSGASSKTPGANVVVHGNFTIVSGTYTTGASNRTLTIGGSYSNSGTFTANSALVTFNSGATGKTISGTLNGTSSFWKVTFNNANGGWTTQNPMKIGTGTGVNATDTLLVTAGTVTIGDGAAADDLEVDGRIIVSSGAILQTASNVTMGNLLTINLNASPSAAKCLNCQASISGTLTINPNTVLQFNSYVTGDSGVEVMTGGTLNVNGSQDYFGTAATGTSETKLCTSTANLWPTLNQHNGKKIMMKSGLALSRTYDVTATTASDGVCTNSGSSVTRADNSSVTDTNPTISVNAAQILGTITTSTNIILANDNGLGKYVHDIQSGKDYWFLVVGSTYNKTAGHDEILVTNYPDSLSNLANGDDIEISDGVRAGDSWEILDYAIIKGQDKTHQGYVYANSGSTTKIQYAWARFIGDSTNCVADTNETTSKKCGITIDTVNPITPSGNLTFTDNYLDNNRYHLQIRNSRNLTVDNNYMFNPEDNLGRTAFWAEPGISNITISNNRVEGEQAHGIIDSGNNCIVKNNFLTRIHDGYNILPGNDNSIEYNNMMWGNGNSGIQLDGSVHGHTSMNNIIFKGIGTGVTIYNDSYNQRIVGNKIFNVSLGIGVSGSTTLTDKNYFINNSIGSIQTNSNADLGFNGGSQNSGIGYSNTFGSSTIIKEMEGPYGYFINFKDGGTNGQTKIWGNYITQINDTNTPQDEGTIKFNYANNSYEDSILPSMFKPYGSASTADVLSFSFYGGTMGGSESYDLYRLIYTGASNTWNVFKNETAGNPTTATTNSLYKDLDNNVQFTIPTDANYAQGDQYTFVAFRNSNDASSQKVATYPNGGRLGIISGTTAQFDGAAGNLSTLSSTQPLDIDVSGTLSGGNNTITPSGRVTGIGTVNLTSGSTFEQRVVNDSVFGATSSANNWTFNNLTHSDSSTQTDGTARRVSVWGNFTTLPGSERQIVRTTTGIMYLFLNNNNGQCQAWKSYNGVLWGRVGGDLTCSTSLKEVGVAIDSTNILHAVYTGSGGGIKYNTLDTEDGGAKDDAWNAEADVEATATCQNPSIAIDSNNVPHVAYYDTAATKLIKYKDRSAGNWTMSPVTVVSVGTDTAFHMNIGIVSGSTYGYPVVSWIQSGTTAGVRFAGGNQTNATSFTAYTVDSTVNVTSGQGGTSVAADSSGNVWVAYVDSGTNYISLAKHTGTTWNSNWTASIQNGTSDVGYEPSVSVNNGTDIYVIYKKSSNSNLVYDQYNGTSVWKGETVLESGTYQQAHASWSFYNNNQGASKIDYLFSDNSYTYYNSLSLGPAIITYNTGGTGQIIVNGTLQVGQSGDTYKTVVNNETNDRILDDTNLNITTKGIATASSTASFTVSGNWTNNGTFTAGSGTVTFDNPSAASDQQFTGSTTFYNFTATTTVQRYLTFASGSTQTLAAGGRFTASSNSCSNLLNLRDSGSTWNLTFTDVSPLYTVDYLSVANSNSNRALTVAHGVGGAGYGDTNWTFTAGCGITISGFIYQRSASAPYEGTTVWSGCNGSTTNVSLAVDTTDKTNVFCSGGDGSFSFSSVSLSSANQVITVWIDDGSNKGVLYTHNNDTSTTITGLKVYQNVVWIQSESSQSITNADINQYDQSNNADIPIASDGTNVVVDSGIELHVASGDTYAPGGNVSTPKFHLAGIYTGGSETLTISGSGSSATCDDTLANLRPFCLDGGTYTPNSSWTDFTGASTSTLEATTYYVLMIAGGVTFNARGTTTTKALFVQSGSTLSMGTNTIEVKDVFGVDTGATFTQSSTGTTNITIGDLANSCIGGIDQNCIGNVGSITTGNLTIGNGSTSMTQINGTSPVVNVAGVLTISTNATLQPNATSTINLTNSTTPISRVGTFDTGTNAGSTVKFTSGSGVTKLSDAAMTGTNAFYNLEIAGTGTFPMGGNTDVKGNMTITSGILDAKSGSNYTLTVSGNFINLAGVGGFTAQNGTLVFNDSSKTTTVTGPMPLYHLTISTASKEVDFDSGVWNIATISGTLTVNGSACNTPVKLYSKSAGNQYKIKALGTKAVTFADVKDSNSTNNWITDVNAINSGNNTQWDLIGGSCGGATDDITALSFQRKTFWDSTLDVYWRFSYDQTNKKIAIEYNKTPWTSAWTAITSYGTNLSGDFSVSNDATYVYLAYYDAYAINVVRGTLSATSISWGSSTAALTGSSTSDVNRYAYVMQDSAGYLWAVGRYLDGTNYYMRARRSSSVNDPTSWAATTYSVSSTSNVSANTYGVAVPLNTTSDMYLAFNRAGTNIEGCRWVNTATAWRNSAGSSCASGANVDSIGTGNSGFANTISATTDASKNVHLIWIDNNSYVQYKKYTESTSTWGSLYRVDNGFAVANSYPTISFDSTGNNLYAIYIRSGAIDRNSWGQAATPVQGNEALTGWTAGTSPKYLTSNYSAPGRIFGEWTSGSGTYSINWNYIIVPEQLWFLMGLGLVLPKFARRKGKRINV